MSKLPAKMPKWNAKVMKTIIDPPMGWKYGFPKQIPNPHPKNMRQWFLDQGYPEDLVKLALTYSRTWEE